MERLRFKEHSLGLQLANALELDEFSFNKFMRELMFNIDPDDPNSLFDNIGSLYKNTIDGAGYLHELDKKGLGKLSFLNTEEKLKVEVKHIDFSARVANALDATGIRTFRDLTILSARDLLLTKNFGRRSLNEVRETLERLGLLLAPCPAEKKKLPTTIKFTLDFHRREYCAYIHNAEGFTEEDISEFIKTYPNLRYYKISRST